MNVDLAVPAFSYGWGTTYDLVDVVPPVVHPGRADDVLAIHASITTYGLAVDQKRFDVMRALFAEQAEFSGVIASVGPVGPVQGADAITTWMQDYMVVRTDQMRHVLSNIVLTELGDETATAVAYLTLLSSTTEATVLVASAFYRFTLTRHGGAWKFDTVFAGFDKAF